MLPIRPLLSPWRPVQAPLVLCTAFVGPVEAFLARAFALSNRARKRHLHYRYLRRGHRRAVRALGCRLSGSTPSRTVGSSDAPLNQPSPVRHCHAIRLASGPSSARDGRRDLHGRIAPCGEILGGPPCFSLRVPPEQPLPRCLQKGPRLWLPAHLKVDL